MPFTQAPAQSASVVQGVRVQWPVLPHMKLGRQLRSLGWQRLSAQRWSEAQNCPAAQPMASTHPWMQLLLPEQLQTATSQMYPVPLAAQSASVLQGEVGCRQTPQP